MTAAPLALTDEQRSALDGWPVRRRWLIGRWSRPERCFWRARGWPTRRSPGGVEPRRSVRAGAAVREAGVDGVGVIALAGAARRGCRRDGGRGGPGHPGGTPDDGSTHWTTRLLAERMGIGKDTVARIWRDHQLQPWKVATFKLSNDPRFEEKLADVVGYTWTPRRGPRCSVSTRRPSSRPWTGPSPLADAAGPGRDDHPRLQAERHHRPLRRPERDHRQGPLRLP